MPHPFTAPLNPFNNVIVNDPWQFLEADEPSIHRAAFEHCCRAIDTLRATHRSTSLLIHGVPGCGKTHLLARLRAHLAVEAADDGPGGLQEAIVVPLRMQAAAQSIWRFLRREFANALQHQGANALTQLERLLLHQLTQLLCLPADNGTWLNQQRQTPAGQAELERHLLALFERLDSTAGFDFNLSTILTRLMLRKQLSAGKAWLRGESLSQEILDQLALGSQPEEDSEELARRIVLDLSRLATVELPIVFCFDQIEALQTHPQDVVGLFAFGQAVATLHDQTQHTLLISCIQSAFFETLRQAARGANWDRLTEAGQGLDSLQELNWEEGRLLIMSRLKLLPEPRANSLWPLDEAEVKRAFTRPRISARELLTHCAKLFEAQRTSTVAPILPVPQFLQQTWEQRKEQALAQSTPAQTDEVLKDGLPRLLHLAGNDWQALPEPPARDVELAFARRGRRVGVSICNNQNGTSLAGKLRRLCTPPGHAPAFDELLLLRDQRLPVGANWKQAKAYRQELLQTGARWVEPSPECLAALDALRCLLADAQAGDLACGGETVNDTTLRAWLINSLSAELHTLLAEVLPGAAEATAPVEIDDLELREQLAALLQRHHVLPLVDAAALLVQAASAPREPATIADCALNYPDRFGVLGNPPVALFELVNETAQA